MNTTSTRGPRLSSDSVLWASAFVLLGLVIVQAGRLSAAWSNAARADVVSRVGDFTILTVNISSSEDLPVVLDGRAERLFVYRVVRNGTQLDMVRSYDVPTLFAEGARIGAGKGR